MAARTGWRQRLADYIREQARPAEKFGHQPRLYALTQQIGLADVYDDDVVYAAAWLHDLGVFTGHRPEDPVELPRWDHVRYVTGRAPALLEAFGFPSAKVAAVLECIRTHQSQDEPRTPEATILRDADILEQLGAMGILRTVAKVGRDTRFTTFSDAVRSLEKAAATLPQQLRLEPSKALAQERLRVLRDWLQAAHAEAGAHLG